MMFSLARCFWLLLCAASLASAPVCHSEAASLPTTTAFVVPKTTVTKPDQPTPPNAPLLAPPTGAVYQKTLPIPVIGRQTFRLHILSDRRAHLRIDGLLQVDEILDYNIRPGGVFSMLVPDRLQKTLRKFRTKLVEFGYDHSTDLPYVVVRPPLPTNIRIQLVRNLNQEAPVSELRVQAN